MTTYHTPNEVNKIALTDRNALSDAGLERTAFDDWKEQNWYLIDSVNNARIIWESATLAEREACAKLCEDDGYEVGAALANDIRARSNG